MGVGGGGAGSGQTLQAKALDNEAGDSYEQEADRVAGQVTGVSANADPPHIRPWQEGAPSGRSAVPESVDTVLARPGRPLEPGLRANMEQSFGRDFSSVRIHADAAGEESARDVNAQAYAVGTNIVFGANRFAPHTPEGRHLLAHELTHVVQQSGNPTLVQRKPERQPVPTPVPTPVTMMPGVTMTENPAENEIVYSFHGKRWVTIHHLRHADFETGVERRGDDAAQVLLTVKSSGRVDIIVDLDVENELTDSRRGLDDSAIGYDFAVHGTITARQNGATASTEGPTRRVVHDVTRHPRSREGLPEPDVHEHEAHWLKGDIKDTYPSFRNLSDLRAYLSANRRSSFAIIRTKDGRYIARPVTGADIRELAAHARVGNFKAGKKLENIDWYHNAYQTGEFQGLWVEGQEYDDLASLRDQFFAEPSSAARDGSGEELECEVYEMGAIDTDLGISYGRRLLSHEEATKRWKQIDGLTQAEADRLLTEPGHPMVELHVRGVAKMHTITAGYVAERDRFRRLLKRIDDKGIDRDANVYVSPSNATSDTYFGAQLDREEDDPEFVAELRQYSGVAYGYGDAHYKNVIEAGQQWAANSFRQSADGIRQFVDDEKKLAQWVLSCPQLPERDVRRTLATLDMDADDERYWNAVRYAQNAILIAAGGAGNGVTLEEIQYKAHGVADKMDDAKDSVLKGEIVAIKQEGGFGDAVRQGVYKDYGYKLDPAAFPYKDKLPSSHAFDKEMMGGSRSSFSSLGEQMFATQLRREIAEDNVWKWAKRIGLALVAVVLVVALSALGAAIAGALFAEGTLGYLAVSAAVVGTGLTASEALQAHFAGVDMSVGEVLKAEAWNVITAGILGKLGFIFKDASAIARVSVIGSAALTIGLTRFLAEHKGPVTGDDLLEFFIENAVMLAAMEAASALARPLTMRAGIWGRAQRLGVKVQEIATFNSKVNNLSRDLAAYSARPGEAAREQAAIDKTVNELLGEQERLVNELNSKLGTQGDAAQVQAEAGEELARIKAAVEGMKRARFLADLKLKPVGQSRSVFTFENAPDAIQKIKDFFPGSRVEPQSDGSLRLYLPGSNDPLILTPSGAAAAPGAAGPGAVGTDAGKIDINRASERELTKLDGIGKKLAKAIVEAREKQGGRFATTDDLMNVRGIGPETYAKIAPFIVAEDPPSIAQRQADLAQRQTTLLDRAGRQGYTDQSLDAIRRLHPKDSTNPKTLDATEQKIAAAEKEAGAKLDAASKRALANAARRLGAELSQVRTGSLSGVTDTQLGDALARVAGRKGLGVNELRGVVWAHLKGVPIENFMDMEQGFGIPARNSALETFGRLADANVRNCERVLSDMARSPDGWVGGSFVFDMARFDVGIENIDAFEVRIQGAGGKRDVDILLKKGTQIELKNWDSAAWVKYRAGLADASNKDNPGQFLKDVHNEHFSPSAFNKLRYVFRYPSPATTAQIRSYLRAQLEIYARSRISPTDLKVLLDAFDKAGDLVRESTARNQGGVPANPDLPSPSPIPIQPRRDKDDDKK